MKIWGTGDIRDYEDPNYLVTRERETDNSSAGEPEISRRKKQEVEGLRGQNRQMGKKLSEHAKRGSSKELPDKQEDELGAPKNPPGVGGNYDGWA